MKYTFKDILDKEVYESTKVMLIIGKYTIFNNMVTDTLKDMCVVHDRQSADLGLLEEFGFKKEVSDDDLDNAVLNSVDFNTFMDVINIPNINGKWFCKESLSILTKKQKETFKNYIQKPSDNGILIVESSEWKDYREFLSNKSLLYSNSCHLMQLNYPNKPVLKSIVEQLFRSKGLAIDPAAIDFFVLRMNEAYDDYEKIIDTILLQNKNENINKITYKEIKEYMKGIENFDIGGFMSEITKPLSSDKTNNKKVLRMMIALEEKYTPKLLVYRLINEINIMIDFRILINKGFIPIGINYFFKDVIKDINNYLGEKNKYSNMNEWLFRKKVEIASQTSLRDWEYMKLILEKSIENIRVNDEVLEKKCERALYDMVTRSVISESRVNNILGIENILDNPINKLNKIKYTL